MKKSLTTALLTIVVVFSPLWAAAAQQWSLDSCISYAHAHNLSVRMADISRQSAKLALDEAKAGWLPTASAGASQTWTFGRALTAENTYSDRNTSQLGLNAQVSVPVFDGLATPRRIKYAKANLVAVAQQYEAAREDVTVAIITAYMQVLYCADLHSLALAQADLSRYELSRRNALAEAGKIAEIDILEAQSQLANDELSVTQTHNDLLLARLDLMQLLQINNTVDVNDFDVEPMPHSQLALLNPDEAYALALQYSHSVAASRSSAEAAALNIAVAKAGYLPRLSLNGGIGTSYYKTSGFKNENFGDQMRHNYSTYFGLSLSIPIFDGLNTRNAVKRARVQQIEADLQLDQSCQQLQKAVQQAYYQALNADKKLSSCIVAENAATKAFEAMQEKYDLGRATPTDYEQAKNKALTAKIQALSARYERTLRTRLLNYYASPH